MAAVGKVLLADDSVTIQKIVDIVLREKGYEVKSVNTGEDALLVIEDFSPDIVLADVQMPGISGYQLTEHIRQHQGMEDLPVILLAGAFEPLDLPLANRVGADGHIIKPFESGELVSKIEELIRARRAPLMSKPVKGDAEELLDIDFSDIMAEPAEAHEETAEPFHIDEPTTTEVMEQDIAEIIEAAEAVEVEELPMAAEVTEVAESAAPGVTVQVGEADIESAVRTAVEGKLTAIDSIVRTAVEGKLAALDLDWSVSAAVENKLARLDVASHVSAALEGKLSGLDVVSTVNSAVEAKLSGCDPDSTVSSAIEGRLAGLDLEGAMVRVLEARIPQIIEAADIKEIIREAVAPAINEKIEKLLWELMPEMLERMLQDAIRDTVTPLRKEVENVIWDTVPEIAENLIKQEIDSIRSGN